jgi:cellulose synthase/poly-beta-1,6-N-acetylglucosamine synthase-like glycosyltransferase
MQAVHGHPRSSTTLPTVDAWVATYDEEQSMLEPTMIGHKQLDWLKEKLHIFVLDDGRRAWLRDLCEEHGVTYVTRPDNRDRKAGNHNHALTVSTTPFIVSMDAAFIPFPNFIYRTIGFFRDPTVAIVQTPQGFYNADPMRKNLDLAKYLPDEQDFFYRVSQPGRDAWDAAFYCGSVAMIRRQAFLDIGGFVTGARIRPQHPLVVPFDQAMHLQKRRVGLVPCTLAYMSHTELAVEFLPSAPKGVRQALVREVYTNPVVRGTRQATFVFWPVVKRLGRLLVAWS